MFYGPGGAIIPGSPALATATSPVRLTRPVAGVSGYRRGRIAVRWRIADQGVGLLRWTIASDDLTTKSKRYVTRARGTTATSASLKLPAGRVHALRFTATDRLQRDDRTDFGRVVVPVDDRAKGVKRAGPVAQAAFGQGVEGHRCCAVAAARGSGSSSPPAGRPCCCAAAARPPSASAPKRVRVRPGRRTVLGPRRRRAGTVTISVTRGSIDLDGVAASP